MPDVDTTNLETLIENEKYAIMSNINSKFFFRNSKVIILPIYNAGKLHLEMDQYTLKEDHLRLDMKATTKKRTMETSPKEVESINEEKEHKKKSKKFSELAKFLKSQLLQFWFILTPNKLW